MEIYSFVKLEKMNGINSSFFLSIDWEEVWSTVFNWLMNQGVKLILGIIVLIIIFKIINKVANSVKVNLKKRNKDKTLIKIVDRVIKTVLKVLVVLVFLSYIGIETASISAIIASLGVGVGLGLQGSLANAAGGLVILIMRPFGIGDYVEAQNESGTVEDIKLFYTYLITPDNKVVMIPNGVMANDTIINYSNKDIRRVDVSFYISYKEDIDYIKKIILSYMENKPKILKDPQMTIKVLTYKDSTIELSLRMWVKTDDYWDIYFDSFEDIKKVFVLNNIDIPYNQMDVHIK